jgi:DNA-binding MarR family transcriptional regulator
MMARRASGTMRGALKRATKPELPGPGLCNATPLREASRRVTQLYDNALSPCGLRSTQRSIPVNLARAGTPSIGELAELLALDRSAMAHNLKPLARDGLVELYVDKRDKRNRRTTLTKRGWDKLAETTPFGKRPSAASKRSSVPRKQMACETRWSFWPHLAGLFCFRLARARSKVDP